MLRITAGQLAKTQEKDSAQQKKKRTYTHKERQHQYAYVEWFKSQYPNTLIVAIPNGEARDSDRRVAAIRGKILQKMGVHAGALDILIPEWHVWVEMKNIGGTLSQNQIEFIKRVSAAGDHVIVAEGVDEAIAKTIYICTKFRKNNNYHETI
jgi:hypothetical protein